ncbi:hypothetical protein [Rhizobium binxianense]|uniref:hypothetical protein n=1 Tax=Rhizobium binxianense TaxID=3024242 RepID=UPI00235EE9CA|nr:hypothetical protein [Rhizobium sp. MJ37]MDC9837286.1 hypothetical protein [Rhizobium sp. MJ37]
MPTLKQLSIALGLLTSDHSPVPNEDGWQNYVWRVQATQECIAIEGGYCVLVQDKWDWKRPQYYSFSFRSDPKTNSVTSRVTLRNEDTEDDDQVCVVASFLNAAGQEVGVFFANWRALPGRSYSREAPIWLTTDVSEITTVAVGTKQCDVKATADAQNFYRIRLELKQR